MNSIRGSPWVVELISQSGISMLEGSGAWGFLGKELRALNPADVDSMGTSAKFPFSLLHPDDCLRAKESIDKLIAGTTKHYNDELRFIAHDGRVVWLFLSLQALNDESEGGHCFLIIRETNVTDLISAREEIKERLLEIESLKSLLSAINKSLDFNDTINTIIDHLHHMIPFDKASVQLLEGGTLRVIGGYGYREEQLANLRFPLGPDTTPSSRAIYTRRPIVCNDVEKDFKGFVRVDDSIYVRSWMGIPLVFEDKAIGLFALDSEIKDFYTHQHVRLASSVAEHLALAIINAHKHTLIKEEARTDTLTGIGNRYGLETIGQDIFSRAVAGDNPLGVLMIDIDHFKTFNDRFGHVYGDKVLSLIASEIQRSLRGDDYPVRYGGEEFVVLLPHTATRDALVVAERLRENIAALSMDDGNAFPTVSIGVFSGVPSLTELLHEFIRRADLALYEAKESGRNRCRVWTPSPEYFTSKS